MWRSASAANWPRRRAAITSVTLRRFGNLARGNRPETCGSATRFDAASASKFVAHLALLGAGKYGVELIANLNTVPPAGATIIVGAPKHEGASGGPCRVYAVV